METWYKVYLGLIGNNPITKVKVNRSTEKSIWISNRTFKDTRRLRKSDYENFFPTYGQAKEFLVKYQQAKEKRAREQAEHELMKLHKVFRIKEEDIK